MKPSHADHPHLHWTGRLPALARITICVAAGLLSGLAAAVFLEHGRAWQGTATLWGWLGSCLCYLILIAPIFIRHDAAMTRHRARSDDPGAGLLFVLTVLSTCASLVAVVVALKMGGGYDGLALAVHVALCVTTLAASWLVTHAAFALHYARDFYADDDVQDATGSGPGGGLDFPGNRPPDALDFLYYAFVVGMTSQVSDVQATSRRMRALTLVHSVVSFGFNLVVLALAVNTIASSIGGSPG